MQRLRCRRCIRSNRRAGTCLQIDLDKVPKKYAGLDGTEIAISESQERMAVVVAPEDVEKFLGFANEENLEAVPVAVVTKEPRLVLSWRGKEVVNISRAFLDTNGAHQETTVEVEIPNKEGNLFEERPDVADVREKWLSTLADLNVCSQKGLVEMFDSSIGAGSVVTRDIPPYSLAAGNPCRVIRKITEKDHMK